MYFQQISSRLFEKNVPARHISPLTEMNPSPHLKENKKKIAFRIGQPGACIIEWPYLPKCWAGMSWSITICCHGIFRTWAPSGSLQGEMRPALSQTHSHFATENRVETQNEWIVFFSIIQIFGIYIYIYMIYMLGFRELFINFGYAGFLRGAQHGPKMGLQVSACTRAACYCRSQ